MDDYFKILNFVIVIFIIIFLILIWALPKYQTIFTGVIGSIIVIWGGILIKRYVDKSKKGGINVITDNTKQKFKYLIEHLINERIDINGEIKLERLLSEINHELGTCGEYGEGNGRHIRESYHLINAILNDSDGDDKNLYVLLDKENIVPIEYQQHKYIFSINKNDKLFLDDTSNFELIGFVTYDSPAANHFIAYVKYKNSEGIPVWYKRDTLKWYTTHSDYNDNWKQFTNDYIRRNWLNNETIFNDRITIFLYRNKTKTNLRSGEPPLLKHFHNICYTAAPLQLIIATDLLYDIGRVFIINKTEPRNKNNQKNSNADKEDKAETLNYIKSILINIGKQYGTDIYESDGVQSLANRFKDYHNQYKATKGDRPNKDVILNLMYDCSDKIRELSKNNKYNSTANKTTSKEEYEQPKSRADVAKRLTYYDSTANKTTSKEEYEQPKSRADVAKRLTYYDSTANKTTSKEEHEQPKSRADVANNLNNIKDILINIGNQYGTDIYKSDRAQSLVNRFKDYHNQYTTGIIPNNRDILNLMMECSNFVETRLLKY